jgi:hypothetical protein
LNHRGKNLTTNAAKARNEISTGYNHGPEPGQDLKICMRRIGLPEILALPKWLPSVLPV